MMMYCRGRTGGYVFGGGLEQGVRCLMKQPRNLSAHFMHASYQSQALFTTIALVPSTRIQTRVIP